MPRNAPAGRIRIGTASWSDPGFVERWYPPRLAAAERLSWYAQHFDLVEVNSSFYAVPAVRLVERWARATPDDFIFDVKVHRLLSRHAATAKTLPPALQRLAQVDAKGKVVLSAKIERVLLNELVAGVEPLRAAEKFGAFLLQLSPAFSPRKHELTELEEVLGRLSSLGLVVELRNRGWMEGEQLARTLEFFREYQTSLTLVDAPNEKHFTIMPSEFDEITNPRLAYLRLHGRDPQAYLHGKTVAERFNYEYRDEEIAEISERARRLSSEADEVHVIFNNNALDFAPHAAARLRVALDQIAKFPPRQEELFVRQN
ncbi:MAG TPA: DUF72 domain-containing protein [Chthoniobacterales bacterium]|nr:DUF72 domain-containing protein [Chthoniobacterales bacterium]